MSRLPLIEAGLHSLYDREDLRYPRSAWFGRASQFHAYLRLGQRIAGGEIAIWLTIANMTARRQRTGLMRELFDLCEGFAAERPVIRGVYVEQVLNMEIVPFLIGRGYVHDPASDPLGEGMGTYTRRTPL